MIIYIIIIFIGLIAFVIIKGNSKTLKEIQKLHDDFFENSRKKLNNEQDPKKRMEIMKEINSDRVVCLNAIFKIKNGVMLDQDKELVNFYIGDIRTENFYYD